MEASDQGHSLGRLVRVLSGGQEQDFTIGKATVSLGRAAVNDIVLRDAKVSRAHARIECGGTGCTLVDLGSANGTRVNGVSIESATLKPGDILTLGDNTLRFETAVLSTDPRITVVDSEADLDATLAEETLSMTLGSTALPRLAIHTPAKTWEVTLSQDALTIGRDAANDIVLGHPKVSRRHACVERRSGMVVVRDLNSTNGVWVGGRRVEDEVALRDGDAFSIGSAQLVFKSGFEGDALTMVDPRMSLAGQARRPVIVVPGFMGSELWRGSERFWPNVRYLFTDPEAFRLPDQDPFDARGVVGEVVIVPNLVKMEQYSRLGDYLEEGLGYERGKDLLEFAYDWRQDVRLSAQRLAQAVEDWDVRPPVTIIAHSMGCLVSRYYVEHLGGNSKVGRLLLLGGPHAGVPKALSTLLLGADLLPFGLLGDRLRQVLATFPSTYQILPTYGCAIDQEGKAIRVLEDEMWLSEELRPHLREARDFRHQLAVACSVPCVSVFGYGLKTVTQAAVQRDAKGIWREVDFVVEPGGDSTIPESSAVLPGSEIHPVQQYHGTLYVDNDVKMRLKLELTRA